MSAFRWRNAKEQVPTSDVIVLAEIDLGNGECKIVMAVHIHKQWVEMLTNMRSGHALSNVTMWSYIPIPDKERYCRDCIKFENGCPKVKGFTPYPVIACKEWKGNAQ